MAWRVAKSLEKLRAQVNAAAPGRAKGWDGTKGDDAHAARHSDHNPDAKGVVRALDITHDPKGGCDAALLAETLRLSRDPRISYVISNRRIASSSAVHGEAAWAWRHYGGANPHDHHCHISVVADDAAADDVRPWAVDAAFVGQQPTALVIAKPTQSTDRRSRMGRVILGFEARRDAQGHLAVYKLPANDGGGSYEVAGINDRYHPEQASHLRTLIQSGRFDEAEATAIEYMVKYTDVAAGWTTNAGVEFYLRDCVFNRGPGGAAKILQIALGVSVDGSVGTGTREALSKAEPGALLDKLRAAREHYEDQVAPGRPNLRQGLINRWNKALVEAKKFAAETPTAAQGNIADAAKVAIATGTGGALVHGVKQGWGLWEWGLLALGLVVLVLAVVYGLRWWRGRGAAPVTFQAPTATAGQGLVSPVSEPAPRARRAPRNRAVKRRVVKKRTVRKGRRAA